MTNEGEQHSPGSQASYQAGGGQLANNGVARETEEPEQHYHDSCFARMSAMLDEISEAIGDMNAELARLREREAMVARLVEADLVRNTHWEPDKQFDGDWVVVPLEDFTTLRALLVEARREEDKE